MKIRAWGFLRLSAVIAIAVIGVNFIIYSASEVYTIKIWYYQIVFVLAHIVGLTMCVLMVMFELRNARSLNR